MCRRSPVISGASGDSDVRASASRKDGAWKFLLKASSSENSQWTLTPVRSASPTVTQSTNISYATRSQFPSLPQPQTRTRWPLIVVVAVVDVAVAVEALAAAVVIGVVVVEAVEVSNL